MSPKAGEGGGRPQGLSLCSLGGRRGSGLRKGRSAAARQRKSSRRTYRIVCLRGSVSTYIQNCLSTREPFWGPKKMVHSPPHPPPPPPTHTHTHTPAAASVLMYGRKLNANMMDGKQCSWIILSIDKNVHRDSVLVFLSIRPFLKYHL